MASGVGESTSAGSMQETEDELWGMMHKRNPYNDYQIVKGIGKSALGDSFMAINMTNDTKYSIKLCKRRYEKALQEEIAILRKLRGKANMPYFYEMFFSVFLDGTAPGEHFLKFHTKDEQEGEKQR